MDYSQMSDETLVAVLAASWEQQRILTTHRQAVEQEQRSRMAGKRAEVLAEAQKENPAVLAQLGLILAAREQYQQALDALIAAAEQDKQTAKEVVRPVMVKIFHILGVRSEISDTYRAKLQSLLY